MNTYITGKNIILSNPDTTAGKTIFNSAETISYDVNEVEDVFSITDSGPVLGTSSILEVTNSTNASNSTDNSASISTLGGLAVAQNVRCDRVIADSSLAAPTITSTTMALLTGFNGVYGATNSVAGSLLFGEAQDNGFDTMKIIGANSVTASGVLTLPDAVSGTFAVSASGNASLSAVGDITVSDDPSFDSVAITDATASTSAVTGALIVTGGIGSSGNIHAGGNIYADNFQTATHDLNTDGTIYSSDNFAISWVNSTDTLTADITAGSFKIWHHNYITGAITVGANSTALPIVHVANGYYSGSFRLHSDTNDDSCMFEYVMSHNASSVGSINVRIIKLMNQLI